MTFDAEFNVSQCRTDAANSANSILDAVTRKNIAAVLCHNDERALPLWNAATERGLRVPDDLSLIGIDDMPEAAQRGPTTFANPFFDIGWQATQSLLSMLRGGAVHNASKRLSMPLVERDSVAPPSTVELE